LKIVYFDQKYQGCHGNQFLPDLCSRRSDKTTIYLHGFKNSSKFL